MKSRVWKGNFGISQGYHSGHRAIDIKHRCETPLYTPENTKALKSRRDQNGSEWLRLSVKGGFLDLVHLKKRVLKEGRKAKKGALIGYSGKSGKLTFSSGCHTHIALWINGRFVEPTDWLLGDPCAEKEAWHLNRYDVLKKKYGAMKAKYIVKRDAAKRLTTELKERIVEVTNLKGLLTTMGEKNASLKTSLEDALERIEPLIRDKIRLEKRIAQLLVYKQVIETIKETVRSIFRRT